MTTIRLSLVAVLHARGLTDREIAEILHVSREVVRKRRRRIGLPVNPDTRRGMGRLWTEEDDRRLRSIYRSGADRDPSKVIAREMGRTATAVRKRARRLRLSARQRNGDTNAADSGISHPDVIRK